MELALQWRGYGISIKLLRENVRARSESDKTKETIEPVVSTADTDKAHRDYLMASGSRYVGPMR